ncbi:MAG: 5-formyltetrahydrofolate cyclo-ligase [Wenzhouxiangella sp.]
MSEQHASQSAKRELRERLLGERLALPEARRRVLDRQLCAQVVGFMSARPGERVSAFWPFRGEPDLIPALKVLHEAGRAVHLPVLAGSGMEFRRWRPDGALVPNRFGIPEPLDGELCAPDVLDWVLMPLLAFSATGTRLGMGGGFYDRTFAFRLGGPEPDGPGLVGLAYVLQEANSLPAQRWDVPLDAVITDFGLREFRSLGGPWSTN